MENSNINILVVEDNISLSEMIREIFSMLSKDDKCCFNAIPVYSKHGALMKLVDSNLGNDEYFHAITLDVNLPFYHKFDSINFNPLIFEDEHKFEDLLKSSLGERIVSELSSYFQNHKYTRIKNVDQNIDLNFFSLVSKLFKGSYSCLVSSMPMDDLKIIKNNFNFSDYYDKSDLFSNIASIKKGVIYNLDNKKNKLLINL